MINFNKFYSALMAHLYLFIMAVSCTVIWCFDANPAPILWVVLWVAVAVYVYKTYGASIVVSVPKKDGFDVYTGKPVVRLAYRIGEHDQVMASESPCMSEISIGGVVYVFKHYEEVKAGDYVVFINDADIYHCTREVFLDRNIV